MVHVFNNATRMVSKTYHYKVAHAEGKIVNIKHSMLLKWAFSPHI